MIYLIKVSYRAIQLGDSGVKKPIIGEYRLKTGSVLSATTFRHRPSAPDPTKISIFCPLSDGFNFHTLSLSSKSTGDDKENHHEQ